VIEEKTTNNTDNRQGISIRKYTPTQELINNIPYITMTVLGAAIFIVAFSGSALSLSAAGAYLIYGIAGAVWIMIFVCPYCRYFDTRECPCGYGHIAAKFRNKESIECFSDKFKKHIPVIVPLWFIPLLAGIPVAVFNFSWTLLALLAIFAVVAFVVLPLVSTKHGCKECPQKDSCPWMKTRAKSA
jgi:hypothetical protein